MSSGHAFTERSELDEALDLWFSDRNNAIENYGDINSWDVSKITDFSRLFFWKTIDFEISNWDVGSGTDFSSMFAEGRFSSNQDITSWDVSSGINFRSMFSDSNIRQDLSLWNCSSVGNDGFYLMFGWSEEMQGDGWSITPTTSDFIGQTITGDATSEKMIGAAGNDILSGLGGNDRIVGKNGWDKLFGGDGNDKLLGGGKDDILSGGGGKDKLVGDKGADTLIGGGGNDKLIGGNGLDTLTGGNGKDTFYLSANTGRDRITDYQSKDKLKLTGGITENYLKIKQAGDNVKIKYEGDLMAIVQDALIADLTFI